MMPVLRRPVVILVLAMDRRGQDRFMLSLFG